MGSGIWTANSYDMYTASTRNMSSKDFATSTLNTRQIFKNFSLADVLNPYEVMRECCDSEEHPYTVPVILALDVTGSMGAAANKVAKQLNTIMTEIYEDPNIQDIEFCIMGIGDLNYDSAPIQISQFESDIRIAEQLDQVYFEGCGGGNHSESYTAAWYMGLNHCKLDCWKRGKKGIIITMGDELPNPFLPRFGLSKVTGDTCQADIETNELYQEALEKFDIYHISVDDNDSCYKFYNERYDIDKKWKELLGDNYFVANLNNLTQIIINIITTKNNNTTDYISW